MQSYSLVILVVAMAAVCHGQFFQPIAAPLQYHGLVAPPAPIPIARAIGGQQPVLGHRAVIENSEAEALLPEQLKNPFYKNPRIAQALAKESWFKNGEEQVFQREAEKIPRQKVFSILKHAGFI